MNISVVRSCWSICSLCSESIHTNLLLRVLSHCCIWNIYFVSLAHTKHNLPYKMAVCTWWP